MEEGVLQVSNRSLLGVTEMLLQQGRAFSFRIRGLSMSPFIMDGDMVTIAPLEGPVQRGDILLIKTTHGLPIIHRVVKKTSTGVITKGDSSLEPDEPTTCDRIVGRVVRVHGRGYNFHLRHPFKYLIALGLFNSPVLRNPRLARYLLKRLASILG